jgi:hypothetical protein
VSLSTEERPDLEDFLWYTEDVAYDGVPSDANIIDNIGPLTGSWKALIIYDPNNEYDAGAMEFLNIALAGTAESLSLTLDWYQIFWANEGESFDETDMEDSVFSGKWESGGLWASGAGTIRLTQFYEQNGKQYAVGTDGYARRDTGAFGAGAAIRRCEHGKILYELRQGASYRRSLLRQMRRGGA